MRLGGSILRPSMYVYTAAGEEVGEGFEEAAAEAQQAPDNFSARKAVEKLLSCSMERLDQVSPILANNLTYC